jgi:hypothetical protein
MTHLYGGVAGMQRLLQIGSRHGCAARPGPSPFNLPALWHQRMLTTKLQVPKKKPRRSGAFRIALLGDPIAAFSLIR